MSEEASEPLKLTVMTSANTIYALQCLKQLTSILNTEFNIGEILKIGENWEILSYFDLCESRQGLGKHARHCAARKRLRKFPPNYTLFFIRTLQPVIKA